MIFLTFSPRSFELEINKKIEIKIMSVTGKGDTESYNKHGDSTPTPKQQPVEEYGICMMCEDGCNVHSQICGRCARLNWTGQNYNHHPQQQAKQTNKKE